MDLSIVIVSYQMQRELPRTLVSLARPYQTIDRSVTYEVIVVDNGSVSPPQPDQFKHLDLELSVISCGTKSGSPVFAMNEGLALARGAFVGAWIDGARLASPGLLSAVHEACQMSRCPVVAPLNWHLGPHRHHLAQANGYDQKAEDALLSEIGWPRNASSLFERSTCETVPYPDGPLMESNSLFLSRSAWLQLGGFDAAFDETGGGLANPDALFRAVQLPDARLIRIADEGTFHQYHGGVTTSESHAAAYELQRASRKYMRLRGHPVRQLRDAGTIYWHNADIGERHRNVQSV
jgi:glycosyltransferase involved in cell wall biosynthesis